MSLESIPTYFSDFFDISVEAAEILLSIMVIMAILLPVLFLSKGRSNLPTILIFYLTEAFLVGIGWLDFWILITTLVVLAAAIATLGVRVITGSGG
jgi:hypothetical protein